MIEWSVACLCDSIGDGDGDGDGDEEVDSVYDKRIRNAEAVKERDRGYGWQRRNRVRCYLLSCIGESSENES